MLLLIEVEGVDYLGLERWWVNGTRMSVSSYLSDTRHDAKSSRESNLDKVRCDVMWWQESR